MNQQIKQRLVGAIVLVLLGVIFVPMVLDGSRNRGIDTRLPPPPGYEFKPLEIPLEVPADKVAEPRLVEKPVPAESAAMPAPIEVSPVPETSPPKTEVRATAPKLPPSTVEAWAVQVGSFSQSTNAIALRDTLRKQGFAAYVEKYSGDGGMAFRVRVGPEVGREQAEKLRGDIERKAKVKGIVVSHRGS